MENQNNWLMDKALELTTDKAKLRAALELALIHVKDEILEKVINNILEETRLR